MKNLDDDLLLKFFEEQIRKNIKEKATVAAMESVAPSIEEMVEKAMESLKCAIKTHYDIASDQQVVKIVTDIKLV